MYILPKPYQCAKCGHETHYSPHDGHSAPVVVDEFISCPRCWELFLRENIGEMKPIKTE
jgi:DNA-directed RNA polymerase subunit RPC12/RpoP